MMQMALTIHLVDLERDKLQLWGQYQWNLTGGL